jgi:hypothetical protein
MECDFSGWATKAGIQCTDGRTILPGAFKHQDKTRVPLVWMHGHKDVDNVLGHAILEERPEGVYAYAFLNDTDKAKNARKILEHGDVKHFSIWANELLERQKRVIHGAIRELSLVLSGANPGAVIESVTIRHSDGSEDVLEDEYVITTGLELELGGEIQHADDSTTTNNSADDSGETVADIFNAMSDKEQQVVHFMISEALQGAATDDNNSAEHSNVDDNNSNNQEGTDTMAHNVFEQQGEGKGGTATGSATALSHSDMVGILEAAQKHGATLKSALDGYALEHGITDIETLFPDAKNLTAAPEWFGRRVEWVDGFLNATRKTPFSRIKTHYADLNYDDARAKGYIKGNFKKEEFFEVASRTTTPTTIYKKQKLDRDDIVDITDFDVVGWMRAEMKVMIKEELARAILLGDGRAVDDEDKIVETNIRPIVSDHELYSFVVNVNLDDAMSNVKEAINAIIMHRQYYRGTGMPTMYTTETFLAQCLILADGVGRDLYDTVEKLATKLRVKEIVTVELMDTRPDIVAILVNPADYVIGMTRGGELTNFEDFDIDFNQHKYLIETRLCGALAKLKSAMIVKKTAGSSVLIASVNPPTFNTETGVVTIVATTNVTYKNDVTNATLSTGAQAALADGATLRVRAEADSGFHLASTEGDTWQFTFHADA